jgi:hypothetical protein
MIFRDRTEVQLPPDLILLSVEARARLAREQSSSRAEEFLAHCASKTCSPRVRGRAANGRKAALLMTSSILGWAVRRSKATAGQFNLTLEVCRDLLQRWTQDGAHIKSSN